MHSSSHANLYKIFIASVYSYRLGVSLGENIYRCNTYTIYVYAEKPSWAVPGRYAEYRVSIVNSSIPGLPIGDAGYIKWLVRTVYSDRADIEIIVDVEPELGDIKIDSMSLSLLTRNTSIRTWIYTENMGMYIVGFRSERCF